MFTFVQHFSIHFQLMISIGSKKEHYNIPSLMNTSDFTKFCISLFLRFGRPCFERKILKTLNYTVNVNLTASAPITLSTFGLFGILRTRL